MSLGGIMREQSRNELGCGLDVFEKRFGGWFAGVTVVSRVVMRGENAAQSQLGRLDGALWLGPILLDGAPEQPQRRSVR